MKSCFQYLFLACYCILVSCSAGEDLPIDPPDKNTSDEIKSIAVFFTNDEHGWMEASGDHAGAAGLFDLWRTNEGYNGADSLLVLSGGDMWTGPAISTYYKGKSMVEVMNAMEYDAAAIGNHEFDFNASILQTRLDEMNFPLLAANIVKKSDGEVPSFVLPYKIINAGGVKVGIIGLASEGTPQSAFPPNVADYNFTNYADAINTYAPHAKSAGAEVLIIVGHIGETVMEDLAPVAANHDIALICGGHTHQQVLKKVNGVQLIETNSRLSSYGKVVINYNKTTKVSTLVSAHIRTNENTGADIAVQAIVDKWKAIVDEDLAEVIGYCATQVQSHDAAMQNMICDSWLWAVPDADVAMTNSGGIRQPLFVGNVTLASIVGILPFSNNIFKLEMTGTQLIDCLGNNVIGGMTATNGYKLADGSPIEASTQYVVLTTDYLYYQENSKFAQYDATPEFTNYSYAQPTIDWIKSLNTNASDPINNYLDFTVRR